MAEPADGNLVHFAVVVVCDPADEARAATLVDALQPRLSKPLRTADSPHEAEAAAFTAQVALVIVSEELEKNEPLIEAAAYHLPFTLVPVLVDAEMKTQKAWQGELSQSMANELYFDFCDPGTADLSNLVRLIDAMVYTRFARPRWDVFLAHDRDVHPEAKEIAECLERDHGFKVWLDEKESAGGIDSSMSHGIESSKVFMVLATQKYMKKINVGDRTDNCLREFVYASNQRSDRILVAALEVEMTQATTMWRGQFQAALARQTPVDLTRASPGAIERLAEAIRQRIETPHQSADLSPQMCKLRAILSPCSSEAWAKGKAAKFTAETRNWILDEVSNWYNKTWSRVLVLVGDGGVGKSVIMAEICSRGGSFASVGDADTYNATPHERKTSSRVCRLWPRCGKADRVAASVRSGQLAISVAAYHFFRHDEGTTASPEAAVASIAWQLCKNVPGFADKFGQVIFASLFEETLADIFETLLVWPLQELESTQARQVVVLDALNECSKCDALLDKVIRPWKVAMPSWLSLVVSTRPERKIVRSLKNSRLNRSVTVLKLKDKESFRDVERHVEHLLQDMGDVVEQDDVKASAQTLAEYSEGLFLWASFLPGILQDAQDAKDDGSLLTHADISKEAAVPAGLGGMFQKYFGRLQDKVGGPKTYRMLLAPIVAAREPLGLEEVTVLLGQGERKTKAILDDASYLLRQDLDSRVALIHKRMADWLMDEDLSGDLGVDIDEGHERLAAYCRDRDDAFSLRHAVYHLVKSGDKAGAFRLLNDFTWVQKAILSVDDGHAQARTAIDALLRDCADLGISSAPETITAQLLSRSINALRRDPNELASQVLARLRVHEDDQDHPLVTSLGVPSGPWLQPVRSTLPHPHDSPQQALVGHFDKVESVAVEGDRVVSGSFDCTLRIWDAETGAVRRVLEGHTDMVSSVALEGDRVVSGSFDKTVRLWNAATGALQHVLKGHSGAVKSVAVEGDRVVSGSRDKTIRVWHAASGTLQHVLKGHSGAVDSVAVEGDRIVSGSSDETVRNWSTTMGMQHVLRGHSREVHSVAVEDDRVVSGSYDNTIRIWSAATGALLKVLEAHSSAITSVAAEGDRVVSGFSDGTIRVWSATTGALQYVRDDHQSPVASVALDGDRLVSGSWEWAVRISSAATGALQHVLWSDPLSVRSVAVDGNRVASASDDRLVRIWNAATGTLQHVLEGHVSFVSSVAVQGDRVVSGSEDRTVRVWDAATGALQHVLRGHTWMVSSVAVEGDRVVSLSANRTIRIWNAATGVPQHVLECDDWQIISVALEGDRVVSNDWNGVVRVWDAATGQALHNSEVVKLRGQSGPGREMPVANGTHVQLADGFGFTTDNLVTATARDGAVVVVGDDRGMVHILHVSSGRN